MNTQVDPYPTVPPYSNAEVRLIREFLLCICYADGGEFPNGYDLAALSETIDEAMVLWNDLFMSKNPQMLIGYPSIQTLQSVLDILLTEGVTFSNSEHMPFFDNQELIDFQNELVEKLEEKAALDAEMDAALNP